MNKIVCVRNVDAYYENNEVLKGINLDIFKNDFIGVIGPNGGGKTTLIRVILGILPASSGEVVYYDEGVERQELNIGYLPQETRVDMSFPINVQEVVLSGLTEKNRRISFKGKAKERVEHGLELLGLQDLRHRRIGELSGGQLQRALIGRAIISDPSLLILDEPNTYMDKKHEDELYQLLDELNHRMAIIIVSHDIGTVLNKAKRVISVNKILQAIS